MDKYPEEIQFEDIDFSKIKNLSRHPNRHRRSPLIVELTDPRISAVDIQKLMEAGMNIASIKMSYSTRGDKIKLLAAVATASATVSEKYGVANWPVATCATLKTCVVKTGVLEGDLTQIDIDEGSEVILTNNMTLFNKCNKYLIFVDNSHLTIDLKVGMEVSISEDHLILHCIEIVDEKSVKCVVAKGGQLKSISTVCVRGLKHTRPYLTEKDMQTIQFCLEYQIDMIMIPYVRHSDAVKIVKHRIVTEGKKLRKAPILLCGICTEEGLDNIDDILKECDGLIISRDFLAYELEKSKQFRMIQIQKWMIGKCKKAGKPVFLSGGVFQDALVKGVFEVRDISDVTNALLDGVTGFVVKDCYDIDMLIDSLNGFNDLCYYVEPLTFNKTEFWNLTDEIQMPVNAAEACVISCAVVANQSNARVIVLPTVTGRTAKALLAMRPSCIVITVSTSTRVTKLLYTYKSVVPLMYKGLPHNKWYKTVENRIDYAIEFAVARTLLTCGDTYVSLYRDTEGSSFCDTVRICKAAVTKKQLVVCPD